MANSFTPASYVSGQHKLIASFDSDGNSTPIDFRGAKLLDIAVKITGTITINLQAEYEVGTSNAKSFETVESYTSSTFKASRFAAPRRIQFNASGTSGGTALCELTVGNRE